MNKLVSINLIRGLREDGTVDFRQDDVVLINPYHIDCVRKTRLANRAGMEIYFSEIRIAGSSYITDIKYTDFDQWYKNACTPMPPNLRSGGNI